MSPPMSGCPVTSDDSDWNSGWASTRSHSPFVGRVKEPVISRADVSRAHTVGTEAGSMVRPQLQTTTYETAESAMDTPQSRESPVQRRAAIQGQRFNPDAKDKAKVRGEERSLDESLERLARTRSFPRFIPDIKVANAEDELEFEEEYPMTASDVDDQAFEGDEGKSPAEIRAEKRKMKRFRLTHSQTRFLQSEFARQAHPDAAQRERLSREIPGLSPRQVQVWFQNRRAKLKRLTSDDRDRVMKSRTLPKDFDTKQTLHSALGRPLGYPSVPPSVYSPTSIDDEDARSYGFECDSEDNRTESPSITRPTFTDHHMAPSSFSVSEIAPPLISGSATAPFATSRLSNSFSRSQSFPAIPHAQSDSPHLQIVTQASRRRAESLASPAGFDLPASEIVKARESPQTSEADKTFHLAQHHQAYMNESDLEGLPDHVYFSNVENLFTPEMHLNMSTQGQWHNFPGSAPMHSNLNPTQNPDLSMAPQHGNLAIRSNLQQPPTHQESRNVPLLPPQDFEMLQSGALYQNLSFNASSFVDHRSQLPQPYHANSAYNTPIDTRPKSSYHSNLAPTSST
ncbi:hypothetical protein MMC07_005362 [Pseudocyphellaria aurata]|nr:hypothetical protein [Pseudocyphellaria aurata]